MNPLSIYIHIPFCLKRCNYCDFLTFENMQNHYQDYTDAVCQDIIETSKEYSFHSVKTIFFGGGTPTTLKSIQLSKILNSILDNFNISENISITTEANPETINLKYLQDLKLFGFNRISFGVQTFNDSHLKLIDRLHSSKKAISSIIDARVAGFENINLDLIFSLPSQTIDDFKNDIKIATSLPITHISTYSLIIEENTPLYDNDNLLKLIPNEDSDRKMYDFAIKELQNNGFEHYEISNFAKKGYECMHNISYWTGQEYIGFGIGASSYSKSTRYKKTSNLIDYINNNFKKIIEEEINAEIAMKEYLILGLRLLKGISISEFKDKFYIDLFSSELKFGAIIKKFEKSGLLIIKNDTIKLSNIGINLSNIIFMELI